MSDNPLLDEGVPKREWTENEKMYCPFHGFNPPCRTCMLGIQSIEFHSVSCAFAEIAGAVLDNQGYESYAVRLIRDEER